MKKKYQISIPDPCQEDWNAMQPTGLGRHCTSCERNIQDYSQMSDNQLIKLLMTESMHCGNFAATQLDRDLVMDRRNLLPTINIRAVAMGFGLLMTTTSFAAQSAGHSSSFDLIEMVKGSTNFQYLDQETDADEFCHFIVMDSESNYVSGAKLELIDAKGHVVDAITTDENGMASYSRMMIKEMRIAEIRVIPNSGDYERITVPFQGADRTDHEVIQLKTKPVKPEKFHKGITKAYVEFA